VLGAPKKLAWFVEGPDRVRETAAEEEDDACSTEGKEDENARNGGSLEKVAVAGKDNGLYPKKSTENLGEAIVGE